VLAGHPNRARSPLRGHVVAIATAGRRFAVSTGRTGRFTILLPPGSFDLTGYSPRVRSYGLDEACVAVHRVKVKAGTPVRGVDVICSFP